MNRNRPFGIILNQQRAILQQQAAQRKSQDHQIIAQNNARRNMFPIAPRKNRDGNDILFQAQRNLLLQKASIWVPDFEKEIYEHILKTPSILYEIPSRKFEELVASIFKNQGFYVELTPESNDGGYDVLAVQKDNITGDRRFLVECKRYAEDNKVGVGIIRALLGTVVDQGATMGVLATTSFFTSPAKSFEERNKKMISLSNYNELIKWLKALEIMK